jgi:actin-like ATPase involved in cell morphogenesis
MTSPSTATRAPDLRVVPSLCRWKVGLDLGAATTVYQELFLPQEGRPIASCSVLPTVISAAANPCAGGPGAKEEPAIGEAAIERRAQLELVSPLSSSPAQRVEALLEFARALRRGMVRERKGWPWGVLACPAGADAARQRELRAIGGQLFERLLLVEEPDLFAQGLLQDPVKERALVVDIGQSGVRASLAGGLPGDARRKEAPALTAWLPQGGAALDHELKRLLLQTYSDLVLTDLTLSRLKEQLAFVAPARRLAQVKVVLGRAQRLLDITGLMENACRSMVRPVLEAIRRVLVQAPRAEIERLIGNIVLLGGGAAMLGLPERIEEELRAVGLERARVRRVENPRGLLALGALKWALLTPDDGWEIPLFAFRPAV